TPPPALPIGPPTVSPVAVPASPVVSAGPPLPTTDSFVRRGFLPKELPPCFSSEAFADFAATRVSTIAAGYGKTWTRPTRYNVVRPGGTRRVLSMPNPFGYVCIAERLASIWATVAGVCQ